MDTAELEARVRSLNGRLRIIEDVAEIENLQRIYGYYLDYSKWDEFVDLFSDNTESIEIGDSGVFLGKAGVVRLCKFLKANRDRRPVTRGDLHGIVIPWNFFHVVTMAHPVIDIDPGGKAAHGRWRILECATRACDGTWRQYWGAGIYENEYIKEDGRWRFKNFHFYLAFKTPYHEDGWDKTQLRYSTKEVTLMPDRPGTGFHPYPDFCAVPFHYRHPITGE